MVVDEKKLNEFVEKVGNEWGASMGALLNFVGDRLGLFKAMAGAGKINPRRTSKKDRHTSTNNKGMACCSSCWRFCYIQSCF